MQRRDFLAATVSSAFSGRGTVWTMNARSAASPPQRGTQAADVIIIYNSKDSAEAAAAVELQKFIGAMTKVQPRLVKDSAGGISSGSTRFLVGRTPALEELLRSGKLEDPARMNPEAYIVRSIAPGEKSDVAFLGGTGAATLYAVYHYLEKACGCGFYWDGDHVPSREDVPVQGIDIAAQPHFSERMGMNLTLYWYSAPWWEWNDWKAYIDWALKARLNILSLWDTPGEDLAWERAWDRLDVSIHDHSYSGPPYGIFAPIKYGVRPPLSKAWREGQSELNKQVIQYARARGMRTLVPAVPGIVPPEFIDAYPDAHTFEISWAGLPKQTYLHPLSPVYHDAGKAFLEEYTNLYGTDHLYWLENYLECDVQGGQQLQEDVRREIAGANFKIVAADWAVRGRATASGRCVANHLSPAYRASAAGCKTISPGRIFFSWRNTMVVGQFPLFSMIYTEN